MRRETSDHDDPSIFQSALVIGLYRGVVVLLLLAIAFSVIENVAVTRTDLPPSLHRLGTLTAVAYSVFAIAWLIVLHAMRWSSARGIQRFVYLGTTADLIAIALMAMSAGGINSGIGLLMLPPVVATALLSDGRISLFFAAVGTLAILSVELGLKAWMAEDTATTQAALLGTALFVSAIIAWRLAARIGRSEAERSRQGEVLDEYVALNDQIVAHLQHGVIVVDGEGRILAINAAAQALMPPKVARCLDDIDPELFTWLQFGRRQPDGSETVLPATRHRPEVLLRLRHIRSGTTSTGLTLLLIEDTAERRRQAQAQKLAALGRLSASIAHEIRNPLAGISHSAQLLDESPDLAAEDRRLLRIIQNHAARVNQIISNILTLSRPGEAPHERIHLGNAIDRFRADFLAMHPQTTQRLQISVEPFDCSVRFVLSELQQVLWNLCSNALHHGGTATTIEIIAGRGLVTPGVTLDVLDDGPGLSAEARRHLFEPFAATRNPAHRGGSGLGLYLARTLCEHNGATLDVIDVPRGCCFRVTFDENQSPALRATGSINSHADSAAKRHISSFAAPRDTPQADHDNSRAASDPSAHQRLEATHAKP
ncbi:MAG: sensor histidine kinase [Thioalkalivibrionaceae bacterium]